MESAGYTVVNGELKLGWDMLDVDIFSWILFVVISGRVRFIFSNLHARHAVWPGSQV